MKFKNLRNPKEITMNKSVTLFIKIDYLVPYGTLEEVEKLNLELSLIFENALPEILNYTNTGDHRRY